MEAERTTMLMPSLSSSKSPPFWIRMVSWSSKGLALKNSGSRE